MKIRSPALPIRKWEPPLYQPRDSPTDDGEVIRRPSQVVVGDHSHHAANHLDATLLDRTGTVLTLALDHHGTNHLDATGPPVSREPGHHNSSVQHQRLSVVDAAGVVVHSSLETKDSSARRRASAGSRTTRKAGQPAASRRRDHAPRRPASDSEPPAANSAPPTHQLSPLQPFSAVPIICNYVDPAPARHDENQSPNHNLNPNFSPISRLSPAPAVYDENLSPSPADVVNQAHLLAVPQASSGQAAEESPPTRGVEIRTTTAVSK